MKRRLMFLALSLGAIGTALAATLGTLWCAHPDKPRRAIVFAAALPALLTVQWLLFPGGWRMLLLPALPYVLLFLFARRLRSAWQI